MYKKTLEKFLWQDSNEKKLSSNWQSYCKQQTKIHANIEKIDIKNAQGQVVDVVYQLPLHNVPTKNPVVAPSRRA